MRRRRNLDIEFARLLLTSSIVDVIVVVSVHTI